MNTQNLAVRQLVVVIFLRLWLVFSFVLVLGVLTSTVLVGENPLQSDNPHIPGFLFGSIATGLAFIYSIADSFRRLGRLKHWITAAALAVWCLALAVGESFTDGEADGWLMLTAVGSLVAGVVAWPLFVLRLPTWIRVAISGAGVVSVLAYGQVVMRMHAMR